jgi:hypothetical protein
MSFQKILSVLTALALSVDGQLCASTVLLTSSQGRQLATSSGTPLPSGCCIRIGTFLLPAATRDATLAATNDFAQLRSWFKPLAEGASGGGSIEQPGQLGTQLRTNNYPNNGEVLGMISNISASYLPTGTPLYVWVYDAATPEAAQQWGIFKADSWLAPTAYATLALSTKDNVMALQGSVNTEKLRLAPIPVTYGNWAMSKLGSDASSQTLSASTDADSDGVTNLIEYAWGFDPKAADAHSRSSVSTSGVSGTPSFNYQTPRGKPDLTVQAECSIDLINWTLVTSTLVGTEGDYDIRTVVAPPGNKCFWRLRFTIAAP